MRLFRDEGAIMGLACKMTGHKWNKLPDGSDGCTCTRCGERRSEGHDWHFTREREDWASGSRRIVRGQFNVCSVCGRWESVPSEPELLKKKQAACAHEWDGCKCKLCGMGRDRDHVWGKPEQSDSLSRGNKCKTHHAVKCAKCGKTAYQPHAFAQKEGCRRHCPGCGYEEAHHEFAGGRCRDCGIDESDYYADLIASGEVGYYDNESKSGQWFVNYGDHDTTIPALTRLFIALADNNGADNYAPESIARKLNEIASEQPEKADSVSASFAQIACDEGVHIYWRSWVMEQDLTGDPALLEEARESVRRWREEHPHSQADIDYENAMIASDSGLYTTG